MKKTTKIILSTCFIINSLVSFGQETFTFKDISNYTLYTIVEREWSVPDYDAEYRRPMYDGKYQKDVENFIKEYEKVLKELELTETLEKKERKEKRKALKKEKELILINFKPVYDDLKRKNMRMTHFTKTEFTSLDLLEATKDELRKLKGEVVDLRYISENELLNNVPKKLKKIKKLEYLDVDKTSVKGEYIVNGTIKVSRKNRPEYGIYENEVLENDRNIDFECYSIYTHFKSADGSGIDFYNNNIDIYDEYTVTRKPKLLTAKEKNIIAKMKIYKGQMKSLINKMALYRSKPIVAREATKKAQILQRKVNALYGNDDDKYYDFVQLLDMETKGVMNEFNQVLKGAAILFGL